MELPFIAPVDSGDIGYIVPSSEIPYLAPAVGSAKCARALRDRRGILGRLELVADYLRDALFLEVAPRGVSKYGASSPPQNFIDRMFALSRKRWFCVRA